MADRIDLDWLLEEKPKPLYLCQRCGKTTANSLEMVFQTTSADNNLRPWMCQECFSENPPAGWRPMRLKNE